MKSFVKILMTGLFLSVMSISCTKGNMESGAKDAGIVTGAAYVTEEAVTVYGYLNLESSVRSNCQFGILYSLKPNPTKDNSLFMNSGELDSNNRFEVVLRGLIPDTDYYYKAYAKYESGAYQYGEVKTFRTAVSRIPEGAVDLGLSVYWATCNVGASKPEEYGGYYQWAGTKDVTSTSIYLDWSNCPYHTGSDSETGWKKYVPSGRSSYWSGSGSPDNKTVLDPSDDVAHVKLGGSWRMPTDAEWEELMNNCTWIWTTLNGVNGYKVTSKKNGNSIFLPAAGGRNLNYLLYVGSVGYFWSSSLSTDYPFNAYFLYFGSDFVDTSNDGRYCGLSVRPVSE